MSHTRTIYECRDTLIEAEAISPDLVLVRYLAPIRSGWLKEQFREAELTAGGWRVCDAANLIIAEGKR